MKTIRLVTALLVLASFSACTTSSSPSAGGTPGGPKPTGRTHSPESQGVKVDTRTY